MGIPAKSTIILDFDNTLYDWVAQWYAAFHALFCEIQKISGMPADVLKAEIRKIHQRHHTSEYSFLIEELAVIRDGSVENTVSKYRSAIEKSRIGLTSKFNSYCSGGDIVFEGVALTLS